MMISRLNGYEACAGAGLNRRRQVRVRWLAPTARYRFRRAAAVLILELVWGAFCVMWTGATSTVCQARAQTQPPNEAPKEQKRDTGDQTQQSMEAIRKELKLQDPTMKPSESVHPLPTRAGDAAESNSKGAAPIVVNLASARPASGKLLSEGSYLLNAPGVLKYNRTTSGLDFVLEKNHMPQAGGAELVITLSPCRVTQRMIVSMPDGGTSERVELSGRVFVFENHDYLIPTANPLHASTLPPKPNENLVREGATIIARSARITRSEAGGEWMVTFDSDRNGQQDPPMILLPCRLLEQMVQVAKSEGDMARLIVSGQVYAYHDRNYLLPTFMLRPIPSNNLSP